MTESSADVSDATRANPPAAETYRFVFHGTGGALFGVFILNLCLTIVTIGVYYFWGKVKTRKFIWGQTEFSGDRFGYHGTGWELFVGWVKAGILFGVIFILQSVAGLTVHPFIGVALLWLGIACLIPLAQIGAMRYRLSRSSWRGIRFGFRGEVKPFFLISLRGLLLTALTAGIFYPFYECEARRYLTNHSKFGTATFQFDGRPSDLLRIYLTHGLIAIAAVVVLFMLVIIGRSLLGGQEDSISHLAGVLFFVPFLFVYPFILLSVAVKRRCFYWNHTLFSGTRFHTTVTMGNLLGLYVGNMLLFVVTLGLAFPWITVRSRRFDSEHLTLTGVLNLAEIQQQAQTATATGEEMGGFLDIDTLSV